MGADLRSLARGGTLNLVGVAAQAVATFAITVTVTRGFSEQVAGVFFIATSVFLLGVAIASLGTQTGLVYFISRFRTLGTPHLIGRALRVSLPAVAATAVVVSVAMVACTPALTAMVVDGDPGHFASYLRGLALLLPFAAVSLALLAGTRGFRNMRPTVLVEYIGRPITQLAVIAGVVTAGADALLGLAWAVPYLPAALLAALWFAALRRRRAAPDAAAPEPPPAGESESTARERPLAVEFWRYTAPRSVAHVAQLALQRLDILLVGVLAGAVPAAIYTAATRFLVIGQFGGRALSQAVQPQLGEVLATDDWAGARALYQTATAWLVLVTWPVYLLLAVFAPVALRVFGDGYASGASVVIVLTTAMLVAMICGMVTMVLNMSGRTMWNLVNVLVALGVNIALDLVLIPRIGILGAAVGWGAAILVNNVLPLVQVRHTLGLHPFARGTLAAAALATGCFGILGLLAQLAFGGLIGLLVTLPVGAVLYAAGCWWLRGTLRLDTLQALLPRSKTSAATRSTPSRNGKAEHHDRAGRQ